jgi:hypothetical protein
LLILLLTQKTHYEIKQPRYKKAKGRKKGKKKEGKVQQQAGKEKSAQEEFREHDRLCGQIRQHHIRAAAGGNGKAITGRRRAIKNNSPRLAEFSIHSF